MILSSANANPPPCLTLAGHNSKPICTSLLNQCRARSDDVLVAILVPLGGILGAPGRPGTPWGPFLALYGNSMGSNAQDEGKRTRNESSG